MPGETARKSHNVPTLYRDPNLLIVFGVTLMAVLGVSSITPAFPRIGRALGLPSQAVGNLITAFTLPGVLLTPILGILADRWSRKRILVPSLMVFGLAGGACSLVRDFQLLLVLRFVQGIGAASLSVLYITLIGDLYHGDARTSAMGYNASVLSVGTASYPIIGGALATLGWAYPFALPIVAVPIGFLVLLALENPEPKTRQGLRSYLEETWESIKHRQAIGLFALTLMTFAIIYGAYLTYLPFLMENAFRASPLVIGIAMSGMSLATALTSSQLGRLTRLWSQKRLLQASCGFYAVALLMIPVTPSLWTLGIPVLLFGVAQGLSIPNLQTLLAGLAPIEHRGAFMSVNGVILRLGQTVGPPLMGIVLSVWGIDGTFYAATAIAAAMFILTATTIRQRRKSDGS
jgi:predicted MFS family arabinose efflux permease